MKAREIRELTTKEIQERLDAEIDKLSRLKMNHSISPLDNPSTITYSRKTVARLQSELRQRQLNEVKITD